MLLEVNNYIVDNLFVLASRAVSGLSLAASTYLQISS